MNQVNVLSQRHGGCVSINSDYKNALLKYNTARELFHSSSFSKTCSQTLPSPLTTEYRCRLLVVAPDRENPGSRFCIGLYKPGTHEVTDITSNCIVHSQTITRFLDGLKNALEESELEPYDP